MKRAKSQHASRQPRLGGLIVHLAREATKLETYLPAPRTADWDVDRWQAMLKAISFALMAGTALCGALIGVGLLDGLDAGLGIFILSDFTAMRA